MNVFELTLALNAPLRKNFLRKSKYAIGENDVEILKGYILYAAQHAEIVRQDLRLSNEQIAELLKVIDSESKYLTTQEVYEYYLENNK